MLGLGISVFFRLANTTTKIREDLDQQTIARLNRAMDDGSLIFIPEITKKVSRGDYAYFALGILNELGTQQDFNVIVTNPDSTKLDVVYNAGPHTLDNNERAYVQIAIGPKKTADSKQYTFDITVQDSPGSIYTGKKQRIYVVVP